MGGRGVAVTGAAARDLTAMERALARDVRAGYQAGAFLMAEPRGLRGFGPAQWFEADPRAILPLSEGDGLHLPRRLARTVRQGRLKITSDRAFDAVLRACADPARPGRWISEEIIDIFALLHRAGWAHSVEAWTRDAEPRLVGGLYGLAIGGAFCAESMFSHPDCGGRDASKVCLVHLVYHLRERGFGLCDVQLVNPHLEQFGVLTMPRDEYRARVHELSADERPWAWER